MCHNVTGVYMHTHSQLIKYNTSIAIIIRIIFVEKNQSQQEKKGGGVCDLSLRKYRVLEWSEKISQESFYFKSIKRRSVHIKYPEAIHLIFVNSTDSAIIWYDLDSWANTLIFDVFRIWGWSSINSRITMMQSTIVLGVTFPMSFYDFPNLYTLD